MTGTPPRRYRQASARGVLKYAIAGGTGMIGSSLAEHLRAQDHEVWVLTRRAPESLYEIEWDPAKGFPNPRPLEGLDGVVNLVGEHLADRPWTKARRQLLLDSRLKATETLLVAMSELEQPPGVYVGVGSLGIVGDNGDDVVQDDHPAVSEGFLSELCVAWENAHFQAEEHLGARVAVLRMSVVLSPTGGAFPLMVQPFRYVGGWLGNGRQYTPWISIRDCVRAFQHLLQTDGCDGVFSGSVPEPTTNKDWMKALGRAMNRPVVTHAPKWALRGAFGELAGSMLLASIRAVPEKLLASGYEFVDTDAEATFRWLLAELETRRAKDRGERRNRRRRRRRR